MRKIVVDYEERPWEYPGARRDYEPYRGPVLLLLANISMACSVFCLVGGLGMAFEMAKANISLASISLACSVLCLGVIALPLGIAVWLMAREDLQKMAAGYLDPAGRRSTEIGLHRGAGSVVLSIATLALFCVRFFLLR